jgi:hypothetical protein
MVDKASAAVKLYGAVPVIDLKVQDLRPVFAGCGFSQFQKFGPNSLPSILRFNEELVDPGTFAAILQAEVEAENQVPDGDLRFANKGFANKKDQPVGWIRQDFLQILANGGLVKRFFPRVFDLHAAHERQDDLGILLAGELYGVRHRFE